jgi:hypothetical protein
MIDFFSNIIEVGDERLVWKISGKEYPELQPICSQLYKQWLPHTMV